MLHNIKKSQRGFTLIEMLIVIAIIAILVAVIMPMVTTANTKASAATNAANLRSVEAAVTAVYLQSPEKFGSGDIATGVAERISERFAEISNSVFGYTSPSTIANIRQIVEALADNLEVGSTYYAVDEVLTFEDVTVNAPKSKALVHEGIDLRKNTEMTITVNGSVVVATYDGLPVEYFAAIAESGKGDSSGHSYRDSNNDGVCDICNSDHMYGGSWIEQITGSIEDLAQDAIDKEIGNGHSCTDANGDNDHICDQDGCFLKASPCNSSGAGCTCTECGQQSEHDYRWTMTGFLQWKNKCSRCGAEKP